MFSFLSMQEPAIRAALEEVSYLETGRASVWHVGKEGSHPGYDMGSLCSNPKL